jgi:hypothetical protein
MEWRGVGVEEGEGVEEGGESGGGGREGWCWALIAVCHWGTSFLFIIGMHNCCGWFWADGTDIVFASFPLDQALPLSSLIIFKRMIIFKASVESNSEACGISF